MDGRIYADWSYLDFKHGRIYHVAEISNKSNEIIGTSLEIATKPAVITIPMKKDGGKLKFLSIIEKRIFVQDLIKNPTNLYGRSNGRVTSFKTPPQGHALWEH